MKNQVILTMKENRRVIVMQEVISGEKTVVKASNELEMSERQGWRVLARVRKKGALGVVHGNRGRVSSRRISNKIRERIVELRNGAYRGFNDRHFADDLADEEKINLGRETVRKILRVSKIPSVHPVKKRKHRLRRKPKDRFGEMIQGDSSPHDWLEGRGPWLDLVHFVDDATGHEWADFFEEETTYGYFTVMMRLLEINGIPRAVYIDKHSVFRVNRDQTREEQLSGKRPLTTFGRAMEELGIQMIYADSPQAKGRVERRGGLNQDRLVSELRKANASTPEEARQVLKRHLRKNNRRFAKKPASPESAFIPVPEGCDLKQILCWKEERTVANDNSFSFQGQSFQIPKSPLRATWAKCKVAVHLCLDGSVHVFHKHSQIAYFKNTRINWNDLPVAPLNTEALQVHSPTLTFSLGH
jgi:hypothetical protein